MTITIGDKTYNVEDLDQEQQHIVGLITAAQTELQHRERCLVVLQHGLQNLQNQLVAGLQSAEEEVETNAND